LIKICDEMRTAEKALEELFLLEHPPTAIFSTSILLTMEILAGLRKLNKKIPRDISVISYEYTPWVEFLDPPLSTVVQPGYQMGAEAISLLVQRIKDEISREAQVIKLSPELVVRQSCSPPIK
jgi:DNA-binding LacI/PurR family transcriptional regulator